MFSKGFAFAIMVLFIGVGFISATNCNIESFNINNEIGKLYPDIRTFYPSDDSWVSHDKPNVPKEFIF